MKKLVALLRLMRPANIVTAIADILAGAAIAGFFVGDYAYLGSLFLLVLSTVGLYGGGVVFNDVFDADLDRVERPERPIPSGLVSIREAAFLGTLLLAAGIAFAFAVSFLSGLLASAIAFAAVVYDKWGKHHSLLGPVNMGFCRGLNLLLGVSIIPEQAGDYWIAGLVPLVYIAAITMVSRGEVHGGSSRTMYGAAVLYVLAIIAILVAAFRNQALLWASLLVAAWGAMIFLPLVRAIRMPSGNNIGKAVKAGVIALILMDAAWAASFGAPVAAIVIVSLLPLSLLLARMFAVT